MVNGIFLCPVLTSAIIKRVREEGERECGGGGEREGGGFVIKITAFLSLKNVDSHIVTA